MPEDRPEKAARAPRVPNQTPNFVAFVLGDRHFVRPEHVSG